MMSVEQRTALDAIHNGLVMWATSNEGSGYVAPFGVNEQSLAAAIMAGLASVDESVVIDGAGRNGFRLHPVVGSSGLEAALKAAS